MDWNVRVECPGCAQEITVDISKKTARCPRCGEIRLEGDAATKTKEVERAIDDFVRAVGKLGK